MVNYLPPIRDEWSHIMDKLYGRPDKYIKTITFQVTEDCCLCCTYCYQLHKTHNSMTFPIAKKFIDDLLTEQYKEITINNTLGLQIDFIGGEPLMSIELIYQICDYFIDQMIKLNHPWINCFRFSICSNGILYFNKEVQKFLDTFGNFCAFSISIDGNKELHDKCRIDKDGNGSYDRAIKAVHHYYNKFNIMPDIKMTLSPDNINYTYKSIINLINEGYKQIHMNCIYEEGWSYEHASILYYELKKISDYLIDNNLYNKINISMFDENKYCPMTIDDNQNWCGGVDNFMFAIDYKGDIYRCIRYMESSLNGDQKPLIIGNIYHKIGFTKEEQENLSKLSHITRRSQSTDECFNCSVASGCGWCSGYNYQKFGTANKRTTYICPMHKATALANVYYWNKLYQKLNINKEFINYLSKKDINSILSY